MTRFTLTALSTAAPFMLMALAATAAASMPGHDISTMAKATGYQPYSKAAFDAAKSKQRVLFFWASWCPNCRAAEADIQKNLGSLPAGVVVFKTDYDKEAALKKQYGITYQHTFVLVDAQGKALRKWSGGGLKQIVANAAAAKKM
ncbi:redoxin domain-containing protein [Deinococcus sp. HMF7620]|uniref:Redoxin domain-containing protein n=1 Tax=Deinococcus arboris TaxID=2682977 RepID=A0A7C9LWK7_9DEIO|nr:thioredoxin family protein [Deinococcus arboris]MVN88440.1 redoxin domain-containing protein [Deinococcus arboris]